MKAMPGAHKTVAIIPAGGAGKRMGESTPKQYLQLAGVPLLAHTLKIFQDTSSIDTVILAVPGEDIAAVRENIVEKYSLFKVGEIVAGGKERQDSVRNGLEKIGEDVDIVVIHDGARPLVTSPVLEMAISSAKERGAVAVGVPVRDTIKRTDEKGQVDRTVSREGLWLTQTPQIFQKDLIVDAYRRAYEEGYYGTDDASLVERIGGTVWMVPGILENVKVTTRDDLGFCEMVLHCRKL